MLKTHEPERRFVPRLQVDVEASLTVGTSLLDVANGDDETVLTFLAKTCDISPQGLSLLLLSVLVDERYAARTRSVTVRLKLPATTIGLKALPAYVKRVDPKDPGQGSVIGMKISEIDDQDRIAFADYLDILTRDTGRRAKMLR